MKYTEVLKKDHEALKTLMEKMKSARLAVEKREQAFDEFVDLLTSHTKAEEKTLYQIRENNDWLRPDILEGLEEHRSAEGLIDEIKHTHVRDKRDAKMKVLCDYVKHHLDEEEEGLFPHFEKTISSQQSEELQVQYVQIRGETQMNPTSDSRGVLQI
jgi:hemerythrin superfamily protein